MALEKILFPIPNPVHYTLNSHENHLFWISAGSDPVQTPAFPCMFYSLSNRPKYLMIWCHGNACDIGSCHPLFNSWYHRIDLCVLSFEYPSYGLCERKPAVSKEAINNHAERAYLFAHKTLRWPANQILVFGHSIGSGPACHLASTRVVSGLILQSPYTSINAIIREHVRLFGYLLGNSYWNNLNAMENIHCPTLFIHGERDTLIPSHHSQAMYDVLPHSENKRLMLLPNDDHGSIAGDVTLECIKRFLQECFLTEDQPLCLVDIDPKFRAPTTLEDNASSASSYNIFTSLFDLSKASFGVTQNVFNSLYHTVSNNDNNE